MSFDPLSSILNVGGKLIDKLIPDPEAKQQAHYELIKLAQDGELQELETRMSAIIAEAKSADPWTSRARPTFLYVMYLMILFAIPMGILSVFSPESATSIASGMKAWLGAIPDGMWATFGIGYSGYALARSVDKNNVRKLNGNP